MTIHGPLTAAADLNRHRLFGPYFDGPSWDTWKCVLKAACAEPLDDNELEIFQSVAGGRDLPAHRLSELVCAIGRGGGKDSVASTLAALIAARFDPKTAKLRPGELVYVLCIATDK